MNHITNQNQEGAMMGEPTSIVATYPTHATAGAAVHELKQAGFDMRKFSIAGRDYHTGERMGGSSSA